MSSPTKSMELLGSRIIQVHYNGAVTDLFSLSGGFRYSVLSGKCIIWKKVDSAWKPSVEISTPVRWHIGEYAFPDRTALYSESTYSTFYNYLWSLTQEEHDSLEVMLKVAQ